MKEVEITREPIELYKLLKFEGLAMSGGEAKMMVAEGHVSVNGVVETQKRKKLVSGDCIEIGETKLKLRLSETLSDD
jgi:ribosome-associated protein